MEKLVIRDIDPALWYLLFAYLSGSVLCARVFGRLFHKTDAIMSSRDRNPGTTNAFRQGGFWCGVLTLCGDMAKGTIPVWLYLHNCGTGNAGMLALVLAAPVFGHNFSIFYHFRGGKGIAVSFGSLIGLFPWLTPAWILAFWFLLFTLVVRVTPDYCKTAWAFVCASATMFCIIKSAAVTAGFALICGGVLTRLHLSTEEKEAVEVRPVWRKSGRKRK